MEITTRRVKDLPKRHERLQSTRNKQSMMSFKSLSIGTLKHVISNDNKLLLGDFSDSFKTPFKQNFIYATLHANTMQNTNY